LVKPKEYYGDLWDVNRELGTRRSLRRDERVVVVDRLSERRDNIPVVVVVTERTQRAKPDVLTLALALGSAWTHARRLGSGSR
jgi:hypothetical protein